MATAEYHTIRIAFDMAKSFEDVVDKLSGRTPQFWRGNDLRFEVAIMRNGDILDVSNLASLTLEVRDDQNIVSAPLMQKTVAGGAMDNTVTGTTWGNNTKQHATFDFTDAETNLSSPGSVFKSTWEDVKYIVLHGVTTLGNVITYQSGPIIFREDGAGSAGTPPTNDDNFYTKDQVDAAFLPLAGGTLTGPVIADADPTDPLGLATKGYVDAASSNVGWKQPVRVASTANVTISGPGASIDSVSLTSGDRVLLKDQSTGAENGIYVFNGAASAMTRASDANTDALMEPGLRVGVVSGTVNAGRVYYLATAGPITVGTTALTFTNTLGAYATTAAVAAGYQPLAASLTSLAGITPSANGLSLLSAANYAAMRTLLDLEVGTDFLSPSVITSALDLKAPLASPSFTGNCAMAGLLTMGGAIREADGTVTDPSYSFTSESDMGIRRSAASTMAHVFSGVDRLLLGESGNDLLAELPAYNFIIDPSSNTNGRGNLGLFDVTGFGTDASGVLALGPVKNAPTAGNATDILLWQQANPTSTNPELVLNSNGNRVFLGEYIGIGKSSSPTHPVEIDANSCWFTSNVPADIYMFGFSSGAADGLDLFMGRGRGTEAAKNQVQSGDALATIHIQGAHDFASMGTGAKLAFTTTEAFDAVNGLGTKITLQSCLTGSVTLSNRLVIDGAGNWLYGGAAAPASLVNGHVFANGTAPSADPTNAAVIVPVGGEIQYRTSAASEGAGQMNRLHNRGLTTLASDYSMTTSYASTGATVVLPTAGTYMVIGSGMISGNVSATGDACSVRVRNTTDASTAITDVSFELYPNQSAGLQIMGLVTVAASKTLDLQAVNGDAARGGIRSPRLLAVRLY